MSEPVTVLQDLAARVARAEARADRRLGTVVDDFFLSGDGRLDDRTRAALSTQVKTMVEAVARDVAGHAARLLTQRGGAEVASLVGAQVDRVFERLARSGLLRDLAFMEEMIGRIGQDLLAQSLATVAHDSETPVTSLAVLAQSSDGVIAATASALLLADSRRRAVPVHRTELPHDLHVRLVWWAAAALRGEDAAIPIEVDHALVDAAVRSIGAHEDGDRLEAIAERLAAAIDPETAELGTLLVDALADARPALFVALLARASGLSYRETRSLALEPDGERLWLMLRAHAIDRTTMARIALTLADADPRRDIEAFADRIDDIAAIEPATAAETLAPLHLHPEYRGAVRAIARAAPR